METQKPRQIAVNILRRQAEKARFLESIVDHEATAAQLEGLDRAFVQELTFGVVRWQATLDWLIARKAKNANQKATLQIILRLGLYQVFWLDRIPDHAAVHETVELAKQFGFGPQAGFVNALMRDYLREKEATRARLEELKTSQPALGYSHPEWLCERWRKHWDTDKLRRLLEWNNEPAPVYARVNTLKTNPEKLAALWKKEEVAFQAVEYDWTGPGLVFQLLSFPSLASLPSFEEGLYYIQDPSTLLAVAELDPQPREAVLDFCAAPGGKATYMAQRMQNQGYVMAQDVEIHRRNAIKQNCLRLGADIVHTSRATSAINFDLSEPFDKVLVDTPCSNTGVMRRRVDLRWRISPGDLEKLQAQQRQLLNRACRQVKPGGLLVYSTCSLEPEENGELIRTFLKEQSGFHLERERELIPFVDGVDGAYVAKLRMANTKIEPAA
jgi:16S rRNA (cytosine967-C5)-methyltransferase